MVDLRTARRVVLLSLTLLSACAGIDPPARASNPPDTPSGVYAGFLNGRFAASQADPDRAATEFLRALALDPANPDILQQAFVACVLSGRPEALGLAARLPSSPVAQLLLADQAARAGKWADAGKRFAALPQDGVTKLLRPLLIAWADQGGGQTDKALAVLRPLAGGRQLAGMYALHAGLIADLAGRRDEAGGFYTVARSSGGAPPLRLAQLTASFESRQQHQTQALRELDALGKAAPLLRIALPALARHLHDQPITGPIDGLAEAYVGLASALHQDGDNQFADILLHLALDLRPDFTAARLLAADVMEAQHDQQGATRVLAAVSDSDPLWPVLRIRQAELLARSGQQDKALQQLQGLARAYSDSPLPDTEIGDVLRAKGEFAAAADAYTRAIARVGTPGPGDWPLFYDRGIAFAQGNDWPKGEADFQQALRLQPNQPLVMNYLAYSWADRGENLTQARQMLEAAARLRPEDGAIIDSLGWVMLRQGQAADSVRTLERAVELDPGDSTINAHLGDAYWAIGRKMEAAYQWRRALILNPLPAEAVKLQAKLHETTAQAITEAPRIP